MAIGHFAVGAGCTWLVITYLAPGVRYPRSLATLGGLWGLLPDIHWVSPVARPLLWELHRKFWVDLFWFHRALDRIDPENSRPIAAVLLAFYVATVLLAEYRSAEATDTARDTMSEVRDAG